jgi:hypothetical protein
MNVTAGSDCFFLQHSTERHVRTEVLPVQWRKNLDLDVDYVAARIMPKNIEGIRALSHQTAVRPAPD